MKEDGGKQQKRRAGKEKRCINIQSAQLSNPQACVEVNAGETRLINFVWRKSSLWVYHHVLDEAPDHLEIAHRMHVKRPAGSRDSLVYRHWAHTRTSSFLLIYFILPWHALPPCWSSPTLNLTWLRSQIIPPTECAGGGLRLGTSIFQDLSVL